MICIAIDGPSGSGKSTIAKILAKKLNFLFLDTGALYRAIAYSFKSGNVDISLESEVESALENISLEVINSQQAQRILVNNQDITDKLRDEKISMISSKISAIPKVREYLLEIQRGIARKNNVIMDGRDIGTVVMPKADVKIFLTASSKLRAKRRYLELRDNGVTFKKVFQDLIQRDKEDCIREVCPLRKAKDAIVFDSSEYTLEETVNRIMNIIKERIKV